MNTLSNKVERNDGLLIKVWTLRYGDLCYRAMFNTVALADPAFRHHAAAQLRAARRLMRADHANGYNTIRVDEIDKLPPTKITFGVPLWPH